MNNEELMMEEYLAHHGIKGMKWGVRRNKKKLSKSKGKKAKQVKDKKTNEPLSSEELNKRVQRLRLEREYKQLQREVRPSVKKKVLDAISDVSKVVAFAGSSVALYNGIEKLMEKKKGS